jgi:hypothetical protein
LSTTWSWAALPGLSVVRRLDLVTWFTSRRFTEPLSNNSAWLIGRARP